MSLEKKVKAMRAVSRGIRFPAETWAKLQAEADKNHRTAAAQVQLYVEAGLEAANETV